MKPGDIVKLKTGSARIEVTKTDHFRKNLCGRYVSGVHEFSWRQMSDFEPISESKEENMTNSALIAVLQAKRGMTTAKVKLKDNGNQSYTYKVMPGVALEKDDMVVVQTNSSVSLGIVQYVDEFADIDLNSGHSYKWIVQKIDLAPVKSLVEEEKAIDKQFAMAAAHEKLEQLARVTGIDLTKINTPMLESLK